MTDSTGTGRLTTHVLDTASGRPAAALKIELFRREDNGGLASLLVASTNEDGRCERPLLEGAAMTPGSYEIRFHVGDYFRASGATGNPFYEVVPVPFVIADASAHYHVPLLVAPFGYSTYRGS